MNKNSKRSAFIITLILIFILLIVLGVTYAWYAWSSVENTHITMKIGEYTTVTFLNGNEIEIHSLTPVYNYNDIKGTTFTLNYDNNEEKIFEYNVYLDIKSISPELINDTLKYVLLDDKKEIIAEGNFKKASPLSSILILGSSPLAKGTTSYTFIIYLDGNEENDINMMDKELSASLRVTVSKKKTNLEFNPITDYEYELVQEENTNIIKLKKYIGNKSIVNVPSSYEINSKTYKVILSGYEDSQCVSNNCIINHYTTFQNTNIEEVYLDKNLDIIEMDNMFLNCASLVKVPIIPYSVKSLNNTFNGCRALTGTIKIEADSIESANNIFNGTERKINVEVPEESNTYYTLKQNILDNVNLTTYIK